MCIPYGVTPTDQMLTAKELGHAARAACAVQSQVENFDLKLYTPPGLVPRLERDARHARGWRRPERTRGLLGAQYILHQRAAAPRDNFHPPLAISSETSPRGGGQYFLIQHDDHHLTSVCAAR